MLQQSVDLEPLKDCIYDWVRAWVPVNTNIIFEKENARRLPPPLVTINLITGPVKYGQDELRNVSGGNFRSHGQRRITASVKTYGIGYLENITTLQASLSLPGVRGNFRVKGFSFLMSEGIADISSQLETGYENRASLDVFFGLRTVLDEEIGYIESTEITPTVTDESGQDLGFPEFIVNET